jgi:hypothetical protein
VIAAEIKNAAKSETAAGWPATSCVCLYHRTLPTSEGEGDWLWT